MQKYYLGKLSRSFYLFTIYAYVLHILAKSFGVDQSRNIKLRYTYNQKCTSSTFHRHGGDWHII